MTPHFSLEQFLRSDVAAARGIKNDPDPAQLQNIRHTAQQMEKVRAILGNHKIKITSGFRSAVLNKAVGGSNTSSHSTGLAVDFNLMGKMSIKEICQRLAGSDLEFDQIIYEQGRTKWCHIGFDKRNRRQVLSWKSGYGYVLGIVDL